MGGASAARSRTNTSARPLVSRSTRLEARDQKATTRPSALIAEGPTSTLQHSPGGPDATAPLLLFPWLPALSTLTRSLLPVCRSVTYTSHHFVSSGTRAWLVVKATTRPSGLIAGLEAALEEAALSRSPWFPALSTLTRSVMRVCLSWMKTSATPLVSPDTRLVAHEMKATKRPSALIAG